MVNKTKTLSHVLNEMGLNTKKDNKGDKNKKKGKPTTPIFNSLLSSQPKSCWGKDWLAIGIDEGRVLTYNEIFSILQYRKYEIFKYKKICRDVIKRSLENPICNKEKEKPFFDKNTRLTLVRIGAKEVDGDGLSIVFKYFTDSLKKEGIISDDNTDVIVDIERIQGKGKCFLGLKLEKLSHWEKKKPPTWEEMIAPHKL